MISSLLMTGTVAPHDALPDARGPLSFPLSSSHTQPPLLIPPSVQSNDCPLHAPYHPILSIFLSRCGLLWILKHGVETQSWQSHRMSRGVSMLQGCNAVNKSSNQHVSVLNIYTKYWEVQWKQDFQEHTLSLSLSLGYRASQQISYQPSSRATTEVRGHIKKVSWHRTRLPSEVSEPNGIKSLLTAASYCHTEPLPSLASSCNWWVNFETDAQPCLDALMWFSFIWIMKELSTILVSLFLPFPVSSVLLSSSVPAK